MASQAVCVLAVHHCRLAREIHVRGSLAHTGTLSASPYVKHSAQYQNGRQQSRQTDIFGGAAENNRFMSAVSC